MESWAEGGLVEVAAAKARVGEVVVAEVSREAAMVALVVYGALVNKVGMEELLAEVGALDLAAR